MLRKSVPLMLLTVSVSPPIESENMASRSVSDVNEGRTKLKPGRPEVGAASVEGGSFGGAPVIGADVGPVVAAAPPQAPTISVAPASRASHVEARRTVMEERSPLAMSSLVRRSRGRADR